MTQQYRKKSFSTDGGIEKKMDTVAMQSGNGAFERMRQAPQSYNERMKELYG